MAGPEVGGWWSFQAKTWGAWREVVVAAGAPLVAPLGCWMRCRCTGLLGCETSAGFQSAMWDRFPHNSGKCQQILPMLRS